METRACSTFTASGAQACPLVQQLGDEIGQAVAVHVDEVVVGTVLALGRGTAAEEAGFEWYETTETGRQSFRHPKTRAESLFRLEPCKNATISLVLKDRRHEDFEVFGDRG